MRKTFRRISFLQRLYFFGIFLFYYANFKAKRTENGSKNETRLLYKGVSVVNLYLSPCSLSQKRQKLCTLTSAHIFLQQTRQIDGGNI
jgi:hypothetical protein